VSGFTNIEYIRRSVKRFDSIFFIQVVQGKDNEFYNYILFSKFEVLDIELQWNILQASGKVNDFEGEDW
jgi:hypothetical protein